MSLNLRYIFSPLKTPNSLCLVLTITSSTPLPQRRFDPTAPSFAPLSAPMSPSTLLSSRSNPEALQTNMARTTSSGSGGVRVGERVIEFGDFPEPVALVEARERAQRGREKIGLGIGR